jgi:diguanylate cyclase (GGDEF)-like protein/PAS domain S-box-containing protein
MTSRTTWEGVEEHIFGILERLPDGVLIVDRARTVLFANRSAAAVLGTRRDALKGTTLAFSFVPGKLSVKELTRWEGITAQVEVMAIEIEWMGREGFLVLLRDVTEQKRAEEDLRRERDFSTSLVQNSPAFFVAVAPDGKILMMNNAMARALGSEAGDMLGLSYLESVLADEDRDAVARAYAGLEREDRTTVTTARIRSARGETITVEWHLKPVMHREGGVHYYFNMGVDITERSSAESRVRESEERYRSLLEATFEGIVILEEDEIVDMNRALETMFDGFRSDFIGKSFTRLFAKESRQKLGEHHGTGSAGAVEALCVRGDGTTFHAEIREKPHVYRGRPVRVMIIRDITELVELREKLLNLSHMDELTGLSNRRGFQFLAYQQIKLANRSGKGLVLIFLDLDNMKWINDTLGHKAGDRALRETADVLRETMRKSDIIARIGGDEFVVLAIEAHADSEAIMLERLKRNLDRVNAPAGRDYELSFSYGTAYYNPDAPTSLEALLAEADELMYRAKRKKKGDA